MTAPADPKPAADPKRRTRHRLLAAVVLIVLAIGGLAIFEQLRDRPERLPAPHEPAEALIATPTPGAELSVTSAPPVEPPPPPVVVNEADRPALPPAVPPAARPAPSASASYVVQAGVFTSPANARSLQQRLAQAGIRAKVETRVQLGPYRDRREAEQAMNKLSKLGINGVMIPAR